MRRVRRRYIAFALLGLGFSCSDGSTEKDGPKAHLEHSRFLGGVEIPPSPLAGGALLVQFGKVHGQDGRLAVTGASSRGSARVCIITASCGRPRLLGGSPSAARRFGGRVGALVTATATATTTTTTASPGLATLARHII